MRFHNRREAIAWISAMLCGFGLFQATAAEEEPRLLGHWPLQTDLRDQSNSVSTVASHGVAISESSARFDGRDDWLKVSSPAFSTMGTKDFTLSLWLAVEDRIDDVPGDLIHLYDPMQRRGLQLSLKSHEVTTSRAHSRTLHFGIDNDRFEPEWKDHGQVGKALFIFALAVHNNQLFAGTCEPDSGQSGRVYRLAGENHWIDCGLPAKANSVSSLAVFNGQLYAGTAKYRLAGSALPESTNSEPGGQVYRYVSDGEWEDCGSLPGSEAVSGITAYGDKLYAGSLYRPAGFFRYDGEKRWTALPTPNGKRVEAMCVHNGQLFASSYDEAHVYRFDGKQWTDCGQVGEPINTQTYSFAIYQGQMYVGTWRSGKVFRYAGDNHWVDCGQLGEELEVMGMLVHNGRLLAGSLPLAGVFQYDGETSWKSLGRVDLTPDVMYRRAWTMAEYRGRVFVGTLPSGRVRSAAAGVNVTYDQEFPKGWHHVAARRSGSQLALFLDGQPVATSESFRAEDYDLTLSRPLQIGFGSNDYFAGRMRDVRFYLGALPDRVIAEQGRQKP